MTLQDSICLEKKKLEKRKEQLIRALSKLPPGYLSSDKNQDYSKWYICSGSPFQNSKEGRVYLRKKERDQASLLANKTMCLYALEEAENELLAVNSYLEIHEKTREIHECSLEKQSRFGDLIKPSEKDRRIEEWQNREYTGNPYRKEDLVIKADRGIKVRSKSEAMIIHEFQKYGIPFHYEEPLNISGTTRYPDFTLLQTRTFREIYWEHAGCLNDPNYFNSLQSKVKLYIENGILPDVNLIITTEFPDHPLNMETVDMLIERYLL